MPAAQPSSAPILSCRRLGKSFGGMAAVKDLSFDVPAGTVLGIGGPNGAGKTTLFELISGFTPADDGEILLDGRRIDRLPPHAVCHLGVARIFQSNAGFDTLSARRNVLLAATYGHAARVLPPLTFDRESRTRAEAALDLVGLRDRAEAPTHTLSVLERKLLMIAGAVATQPRVLLMDEPVGGLNPEEMDGVLEIVRRLNGEGMTILLIEHVMRFLIRLSQQVMIMHHGEKIYEGSAAGLPHDEAVKTVYLGERMSRRLASFSAEEARA
jgi:branched-chain amino acid transport system ATP-binding protein